MNKITIYLRTFVRSAWNMRLLLLRFGVVGLISTLVQLVVLQRLVGLDVVPVLANAIGFVLGAQVSYLLSTYVTWRDRAKVDGHRLSASRWVTFNSVALVALGVSSLVFVVVEYLTPFSEVIVSMFGIASGVVVTFFANNWITFRKVGIRTKVTTDTTDSYPFDLSIVIPAYREASRIENTLQSLADYLDGRDFGRVEVIVVTADSSDGTADIVSRLGGLFSSFTHVYAGPKIGKGRDVALGMLKAGGKYRVFMDADLATPLKYLEDMKRLIDDGKSIGIGVRSIGEYHESAMRNFVSRMASLVSQIFVIRGISDTQCGFKMFEASLADEVFGRMRILQWNFDMEVLMLCRKLGHSIDSIFIHDWSDPKPPSENLSGESKLFAILQGIVDPARIGLNLAFGRYSSINPKLFGDVKIVNHSVLTKS